MDEGGYRVERIGLLIAARRRELGLSEEDVARKLADTGRCCPTRTDVWRWEVEYQGRAPGPLYLPLLAAVLDLDESRLRRARAASKAARAAALAVPAPRTAAEVIADALPPDTELSPCGTSAGRTVGAADAEALLRRVHGLRLADDLLAGRDLVTQVSAELDAAILLHNNGCHTEAVGRRLLTAVGELAQLAGWAATDSGGRVDPVPLFRKGVAAARQAHDGALAAHLLGSWAYWESNRGRLGRALELLGAAGQQATTGDCLRARSLTSARTAWVAALCGDQRTALGAISTTLDQVDQADAELPASTDPRLWLYWVTRAEHDVMAARVYTTLHRPLRAVPLLRTVLADYNSAHAREYALYSSWLVTALLDGGEPEEAAAVADTMFAAAAAIPSSRAADRTRTAVTALRHHQDDIPEVAEVLARWSA
ncbi:transcriptional regulator [Kitasatospora sp. NPDC101235]|uniref:transcriptional regulator n=1 Tax=Kitasatospora sp. NPDC101235 TaxID=3364101 RepID=UPI003830F360